MTVAVLALQGAFAEHENVLKRLDVDCIELRQAKDLETPYDGIILPGGESTVQGKLLKELGMFDTIKEQIENGMPVLATCAGLILLASEVEGQEGCHFGTIPMCVRRNAYGRQLGSFHTTAEVKGVGEVPMTFIRAPYVAERQGMAWKSLPQSMEKLSVCSIKIRWHSHFIRSWMTIPGFMRSLQR